METRYGADARTFAAARWSVGRGSSGCTDACVFQSLHMCLTPLTQESPVVQ